MSGRGRGSTQKKARAKKLPALSISAQVMVDASTDVAIAKIRARGDRGRLAQIAAAVAIADVGS